MSLRKIEIMEEFNGVLNEQQKFYLLKNSTTCPISHEAYTQTESFAVENEDIPVFYLNVQEARNLSNEIAERFNVKHESPQIILFQGSDIVWHASHWKVTNKNLVDAWEAN